MFYIFWRDYTYTYVPTDTCTVHMNCFCLTSIYSTVQRCSPPAAPLHYSTCTFCKYFTSVLSGATMQYIKHCSYLFHIYCFLSNTLWHLFICSPIIWYIPTWKRDRKKDTKMSTMLRHAPYSGIYINFNEAHCIIVTQALDILRELLLYRTVFQQTDIWSICTSCSYQMC